MFNFCFLLKVSLMQLVIVGLANFVATALVLLGVIELAFVALNLFAEIKYRHLRSILMLIPRVAQSLFILTLECFLLIHYS